MNAYLTDHSSDRLKKRVGIPKRAHRRMAKIAMERGMAPDFAVGGFKSWLEGVIWRSAVSEKERDNVMLRIHGYELYIFRRRKYFKSTSAYALLITVLNVPKYFWKLVDSARVSSDLAEDVGT